MAAPGATPFREVPHRGIITISVMTCTLMQVLDVTIANIALPTMQASLGATQDTISWVLTSYVVASAIATPLTGWIADRLGRKRVFITCVIGFITASALCGSAQSLEQMVFYRLLQGACGAALVPLSQAVLLDINPRERHGSAMAVWGAGIMVGPILGPTLGGWLTETLNWRWVFYINLPVGLLGLAGLILFLPETRARIRRFDLFGFTLLTVAVGSLQLMLDRGAQLDWLQSTEVWIELGLFAAALWVFVIHTATAENSFIDARLFRDRNFVVACVLMVMTAGIMMPTTALLPPMLEHVYGYPTIIAGLVLAPRGFGTMAAMLIAARLMRVVDPRLILAGGLLIVAVALWQMIGFSPEMGVWPLVSTGIVHGIGFGFLFAPLNTVAFATLAPDLRTEGSAFYSLARNLGASIGVSLFVTLLTRSMQIGQQELGQRITAFSDLPGGAVDAARLAAGDPETVARLAGLVGRQAAMIAYLNDFMAMLAMVLAAMPLLLLVRLPRARAAAAAPAE